MLLNKGRHPYTNETIIPEEVVEHVAYGRSVSQGKPEYPGTGRHVQKSYMSRLIFFNRAPEVYGAGQWRYSYQGHDIIEHGGT
jgi:hypothetical protein